MYKLWIISKDVHKKAKIRTIGEAHLHISKDMHNWRCKSSLKVRMCIIGETYLHEKWTALIYGGDYYRITFFKVRSNFLSGIYNFLFIEVIIRVLILSKNVLIFL